MPRTVLVIVLLVCGFTAAASQDRRADGDSAAAEIIGLERAALDRWIKLDPDGYLGLFEEGVTYFDPRQEKRVDGLEAMKSLLAPIRTATMPFSEPRYEMIDPKVQRHGEVALLTFNLVNYARPPGRAETVLSRWNATEVYRQAAGRWRIVHSHWSFVKPDVKPAF